MPYVGQIKANESTQSQVERAIQNRLIEEKIFRWPTITILVPEETRVVRVGGQLRVPQRVFWKPAP